MRHHKYYRRGVWMIVLGLAFLVSVPFSFVANAHLNPAHTNPEHPTVMGFGDWDN